MARHRGAGRPQVGRQSQDAGGETSRWQARPTPTWRFTAESTSAFQTFPARCILTVSTRQGSPLQPAANHPALGLQLSHPRDSSHKHPSAQRLAEKGRCLLGTTQCRLEQIIITCVAPLSLPCAWPCVAQLARRPCRGSPLPSTGATSTTAMGGWAPCVVGRGSGNAPCPSCFVEMSLDRSTLRCACVSCTCAAPPCLHPCSLCKRTVSKLPALVCCRACNVVCTTRVRVRVRAFWLRTFLLCACSAATS